jgi:hypothetical protein
MLRLEDAWIWDILSFELLDPIPVGLRDGALQGL